jgi:hypothetical protein
MRILTHTVCVLVVLACSTPSQALTGAEFLQAGRGFAEGYAWGVLEAQLFTVNEDDPDFPERRLECVRQSKITSGTFHEAVSAQIRSDPSLLKGYALGAVYVTLFKICGSNKLPHL